MLACLLPSCRWDFPTSACLLSSSYVKQPGVAPPLDTFYSMKLQGQDPAWRGTGLQSTERSLSKHSHLLFAGASIRRWYGESCTPTASWAVLPQEYALKRVVEFVWCDKWSRRSGLNGRPAVYEDQTQTIAPLPNPLPNPANRLKDQRDRPHRGLHPVALRVTGERANGYRKGYT
jgi:hypothetical protein